MNVAVLGASDRPDRPSFEAVQRLQAAGYRVFPVHPRVEAVAGIRVFARLADLPEPPDTITVYLAAPNSIRLAKEILNSGARRVIFNPGAENPTLADQLLAQGIHVVEACTLVLLGTGQFNEA